MGEKSKAVKRFSRYDIVHADGARTHVQEVVFVDPSTPDVAVIHRELRPPACAEFINIELEV